jgi:cytochrome c-type biogenesis protein CcmE
MSRNTKIIIGVVIVLGVCILTTGFIILGASGLYFANSLSASSVEYFMSVSEIMSNSDMMNKSTRISGAVIGDSIEYNEASKRLTFLIADVPADYEQVEQQGGIAVVLEKAVSDPNLARIQVVYIGEKPELLRNTAQAIMTGQLHTDGIFYADEILLKCPSRYEEAVPDQAVN